MPEGHGTGRAKARAFFVAFAALTVVVVLAGFARTFFVPVARGAFRAPVTVYIHLSCFLAWVLLLVVQTILALAGKLGWHRRLGWSSAVLIPAMAASGVAVSLWATARDLRAGQGEVALAFFFGLLMDVASFVVLAAIAVAMRRKSQVHKRLIVIATIGALGPALGRIPVIGNMSTSLTVALVLSIAAYDLVTQSRVHAATLWGGSALLASQFAQAPIGGTAWWLSMARRIMMHAPY